MYNDGDCVVVNSCEKNDVGIKPGDVCFIDTEYPVREGMQYVVPNKGSIGIWIDEDDLELADADQEFLKILQIKREIRRNPDDWEFEISEICPHCDEVNDILWNPRMGYVYTCKNCGKRIMLCDACMHMPDNPKQDCNWKICAMREEWRL